MVNAYMCLLWADCRRSMARRGRAAVNVCAFIRHQRSHLFFFNFMNILRQKVYDTWLLSVNIIVYRIIINIIRHTSLERVSIVVVDVACACFRFSSSPINSCFHLISRYSMSIVAYSSLSSLIRTAVCVEVIVWSEWLIFSNMSTIFKKSSST